MCHVHSGEMMAVKSLTGLDVFPKCGCAGVVS